MIAYVFSMFEQALFSLLNFGLNLWLIRRVGAAEYGVFILWNNIALILNSGQNAITLAHLVALPPGADYIRQRIEPERVLLLVTALLLLAAGVGGAVFARLGGAVFDADSSALAAGLFLPAVLVNAYARALAFSRGAADSAVFQTGSVLLLSILVLGGSQVLGIATTADRTMLMMSAIYGLVGVVGIWKLSGPVIRGLRLSDIRGYRQYLGETRWTLIGVGATEFIGRFYSLIVTAWFGTAALGVLSAAQVLLRPAILAVNAWGWIARSNMSSHREEGNRRAFMRTLTSGLIGTTVISVPWGAIVYLAWPLVSRYLFGGRYADAGWIALLWGFAAAGGGWLAAMSTAFQALRAFKLLAYADLAGAGITVIATLGLLSVFSYPMSLVGMLTGQVLEVVLLFVLLPRYLGQKV